MTRPELLNQAVVEAARAFMATHLRAEAGRAGNGLPMEVEVADALQGLRDALSAQGRARVRR